MFINLLKYNLKSVLKSILPFIIFLVAATIMMNITSYDYEFGYMEIAGVMSQTTLDPPATTAFLNGLAQFLIYISLILLLTATVYANWRRFSKNFYSDEAYLTHTLPVSRTTLWGSMVATVLISCLAVIAVLVLSGFLLVLSSRGQRFLDSLGLLGGCASCFGDYYSLAPREFSFYLSYVFILFTELIFLTFCGFTGIIIKNRTKKSVALLSGFVIYFIGNCLLLGVMYLSDPSSTIDGTPTQTAGVVFDTSFTTKVLFYISLIYTGYCTILYFVDQKLLKRGINLD